MSALYLILHKVRGEPAFDIATRLTIGDEEGWLIPTSGHRAYPHRWWNLEDLADISDCPSRVPMDFITYDESLPPDLRDHYQASKSKPHLIAINLGAVEPADLNEILKDLLGA